MTGIGDGSGGFGTGLRAGSYRGTGVPRGGVVIPAETNPAGTWDSDDGSVIGNGAGNNDNVQTWQDNSGQGRDASTVSNRWPKTNTRTRNGRNVVQFQGSVGTGSAMRVGNLVGNPAGFAGDAFDQVSGPGELRHFYIVAKKDPGVVSATLFSAYSSGTGRLIVRVLNTGAVRVEQDSDLGLDLGDYTSTATPFVDNDYHLLEWWTGASLNDPRRWGVRVDGVEILSGAYRTFSSIIAWETFDLGHFGETEFFEGDIASWHSNKDVLDETIQDGLRSYWADRWALDVPLFPSKATDTAGAGILALPDLIAYLNPSIDTAATRIGDELFEYNDPSTAFQLRFTEDLTQEVDPWQMSIAPQGDAVRPPTQANLKLTTSANLSLATGVYIVGLVRWGGTAAAGIRGFSPGDTGDKNDLLIDATGQAQYRFDGESPKLILTEPGNTFADEGWHVFELINRSDADPDRDMSFYLDGVEVGAGTYDGFASAFDLSEIQLEGDIDVAEVAVFPYYQVAGDGSSGAAAAAEMLARREPVPSAYTQAVLALNPVAHWQLSGYSSGDPSADGDSYVSSLSPTVFFPMNTEDP